ncbi:MAG TPA: hypothetical protein VF066_04210 [Thermoleophilaceae bacterium]
MGKRSRKRPAPDRPASTRAERDARRRQAAAVAPRRATREAPPAPWGSFPLTELVVLIALVFGVIGFIRFEHHTGKVMVAAAMVLGSLGGLEVSIREHFAGFRSHTTLLAASCAVGSMILISVIAGKAGLAILALVVGVGVLVFVLAFYGLRQAFMRRSGGLGFR